MSDLLYMRAALDQAVKAAENGEVPVGAVIVRDGQIIAACGNTKEASHDATAHAEINALREAYKQTGTWRLSDCEIFVTMEPCPMCAGALLASRVKRIVFGTKDPVAGALGSVLDMNTYPAYPRSDVRDGVLADDCRSILTDFFRKRRTDKKD